MLFANINSIFTLSITSRIWFCTVRLHQRRAGSQIIHWFQWWRHHIFPDSQAKKVDRRIEPFYNDRIEAKFERFISLFGIFAKQFIRNPGPIQPGMSIYIIFVQFIVKIRKKLKPKKDVLKLTYAHSMNRTANPPSYLSDLTGSCQMSTLSTTEGLYTWEVLTEKLLILWSKKISQTTTDSKISQLKEFKNWSDWSENGLSGRYRCVHIISVRSVNLTRVT